MEPIIKIKNLCVELDGKEILKDVTFDVFPEDVISIVGPNGAGKSVLLKTIVGIIKPTSGSVEVAPGAKIGYLPQRFAVDRYLPMTVMEFMRLKPGVTAEQIMAAAKQLKFSREFFGATLASLSSGQLEKVLITWVIADQPDLILFDEPTENIDLAGQESVYQLIDEYHHQTKRAVVLVSHDLNVVYRYSHQVICLNHRLLCSGPPQEALTKETLERVYGEHAVFAHHHH
jgi:zinc transport system ATP-binding protein